MADLGVSGLASNFDWRGLIAQLSDIERVPQQRLRSEQNLLQQRNNAYSSLKTQFSVLQQRVDKLNDSSLFESRTATTSDSAVATVSTSPGAALGTYELNITQLATAAKRIGASNIGAALNATNDVSGLTLSNAGFSSAVTAGVFTVNGKQITVATTDSLQDVFDDIATATGGDVTASYDSTQDKITFASSGEIVLGSATDSSNFLTAAKLYNNGTGAVTSSAALGAVKQTAVLNVGNFGTTISDGGSGEGSFKINGVSISFNASVDSLTNVIDRINSSAAGVTASFDAVNDRVTLTNKTTGDVGIAVEDVAGNFAAATGLSAGTLERGQNLLYTVNAGGTLQSASNTITQATSGIPGLSITALSEGAVTVGVSSDTTKIKAAINDFVTEYNRLQTQIESQTASTTDSAGKVTAGILANDREAFELSATLRTYANTAVTGLSGALKRLDDIGITSNGNDNKLALSDAEALDDALANNLAGVKKLFTDSADGIAIRFDKFLEKTIGDDGSLIAKQTALTKQTTAIDAQIANLERLVQANEDRLEASFISMEKAQAQINQQLQFLSQRFGAA